MQNLQELPKLIDSLNFLYIEHAIIEKAASSVVAIQKDGKIPIPIATITTLLLGPGTSITHAAIRVIAEAGCMIIWCGEYGEKYYAHGSGETRSARNLLVQAKCCMDERIHLQIVKAMYLMRFPDLDAAGMSLQQIRGMEGIRIRRVYQQMSEKTGVPWVGRSYRTESWDNSDDINKALSQANSLLYGLCHAAIVSLGYSPGLGFIHVGKQLSFVYDIADLYKTETTIPAAFEAVQTGQNDYVQLRRLCRRYFNEYDVLGRIAKDISSLFQQYKNEEQENMYQAGDLWDGNEMSISGGVNHGDDQS